VIILNNSQFIDEKKIWEAIEKHSVSDKVLIEEILKKSLEHFLSA